MFTLPVTILTLGKRRKREAWLRWKQFGCIARRKGKTHLEYFWWIWGVFIDFITVKTDRYFWVWLKVANFINWWPILSILFDTLGYETYTTLLMNVLWISGSFSLYICLTSVPSKVVLSAITLHIQDNKGPGPASSSSGRATWPAWPVWTPLMTRWPAWLMGGRLLW